MARVQLVFYKKMIMVEVYFIPHLAAFIPRWESGSPSFVEKSTLVSCNLDYYVMNPIWASCLPFYLISCECASVSLAYIFRKNMCDVDMDSSTNTGGGTTYNVIATSTSQVCHCDTWCRRVHYAGKAHFR